MRKNYRFFLLVTSYVLLVTIFTGCAKREIKNLNSTGKNIICFGDSITFGYGVEKGEGYPSILAKIVNIPVINTGIDGDTSWSGLKRIRTDVLEKDPFLVIIEFGGNDFLKKVSQEATINNVAAMVDTIQAYGAMVAIMDISAGMFLAEYRKQFSKLAKEKQAIFIPQVLKGIITNPSMKSDFLHPNASGYKLVAQRVYRALRPFLKQNNP